jgi:hypothetical protein
MKKLPIASVLLALLAVGPVFPTIAVNMRFGRRGILAGKVRLLELFMDNPLAELMAGPPL